MSDRDMSDTELIKMHLNYGPGGNHHIDAEVWRRWPELKLIQGRHEGRRSEISQKQAAAGTLDLDDLTAANPEQEAEYERYMRQYTAAVRALAADPK